MAMPGVSIVIPSLGRSKALPRVIAAIGRQHPMPHDIEVLLCVDALGSMEQVGALRPEEQAFTMRVLQAERAGASAARNVGWRAARAPLVLFLDDDIVPRPELLAEHLDWHRRHPDPVIGVLGYVRWSDDVPVTPFMRWLETGIQFDYATITGTEVGWQRFYSCNVSVKRIMLERTDGFDAERFPYGYEDLELARRMHADHGFRLLYNARAVGEHLKTETLEGWRRNLKRIAIAERRFTTLYPEERPYFYERFRAAAQAPVARGRSARLAPLVGPGFPWLGRLVWRSFDLVCMQRLAPEFLAEWDAAGIELDHPATPSITARPRS